ncbi:hypothetical protein E0I26_03160 [Flavobacterium rhamnosiphilum]|uniref:Lipocalin-like domain-containing protein n=1 Tax=Flavobacterium rhamnosiphilum TaxID=2541724 RepID=A0A4R5FD78_9FLAO|nr:hypothetical protein [Flavobacterium rhamnosiphilum]TDE47101.1 hypothetical protein E0I26_03160 [Flavobacterium rhamnosiphilum]
MIILSFFSLFLFSVVSCNQTIEENKYNGKWILQEQNYNEDIIFKDGNYTKKYSSDDLRVNSSGKFYLNRNENRIGITISLIPNKIISENDTIFQECENLDVIEINDSNLIILKPNQRMRDVNDRFIRVNEILIYKKAIK